MKLWLGSATEASRKKREGHDFQSCRQCEERDHPERA